MAKKGKAKISKVKRNNQTTNKMRKKGQLKLQRHKNNPQKNKQPVQMPQVEYSSDSDEPSGDEFGDMLDEDEQKYLMTRLAKQPQLLSNVPEKDPENKGKKRKKENKERPLKRPAPGSDSGAESDEESGSDLEGKYEKEMTERPPKKLRALLPIKTKEGLMERSEEVEDSESEQEDTYVKPSSDGTDQDSASDSGMEGTGEEGDAPDVEAEEAVVTAVELLAVRRDKLRSDKLRIGALCSSLLESPEKKLKNLYPILYLMEERLKDGALNLHSIRKLATISAFEVFKDVLPDYQIRHQDYSNIKLKKDTLSLYKYEKELLEFYKRYLQRLERAAGVLRRKKGDTRKPDEHALELAVVSLRCMCGLLEARPAFNYATNIAQSVVPFLASGHRPAQELVSACCTSVFHQDNKGEITLTIVRLINQLVKRRGERVPATALDCLLTLDIRDVDMDAEVDVQVKKKQEEKHKKRIVNLSKKEKKRAKKLKEVERELLETEAQESSLARKKLLTEVTKTVFQIYFRLLKNSPSSKLLAAALNGLAKFTHVINLEYYSALVSILGELVSSAEVGPRERLLVVRTVLAVLAGAGDALNVDPAKFHAYLYAHALDVHAGGTHANSSIVVEAVQQVCGRVRRVSPAVLQALAKRLCTLSTQLLHNGTLACIALVHQLAQQSKPVSLLLECDPEAGGGGRYDPTVPSPEHCHAQGSAAYEAAALRNHYHPTVRAAAGALLRHTQMQEFNKMSPIQIYNAYDGSQMSFKPAVPPPKKSDKQPKRTASHVWVQTSFKELCESVENNTELIIKDSVR